MAEITNSDLQKLREALKMPRWKVAQEIGISEDVLRRWETGEVRPDPDDVDKLERIYKADHLWYMWMRSTYESFRARYPDIDGDSLPVSLMRVRHEMSDVSGVQDRAERDSIDGRLDDPILKQRYVKELEDLMGAIQRVLDKTR